MQKTFKILDKEPYQMKAKDGRTFDKCRYKTDSDMLDLFDLNLEIGKSYDFESYEKQVNGKVYTNWRLTKPKSTLELRIDDLENRVKKLEANDPEGLNTDDAPF